MPLVACRLLLKLINENESSADCVLMANWSSVTESSRPVSQLCARLAVNQSDADAVETGTQYSFHSPTEGRQDCKADIRIRFFFLFLCVFYTGRVTRLLGVFEKKTQRKTERALGEWKVV